jgi:hydroxymethylglutaryl-CoA synthase
MTTVGIAAVGASAGRLRLQVADVAAAWGSTGARGRVAVCAGDEDPLTLAWDAGTSALAAARRMGPDIDALYWGSGRPPFADGPSHAYLAAALGLGPGSGGLLATGSPHAGMDALLAAWDAVTAGSARTALVVASDAASPGLGTTFERRAGAGAVALLLTADGGAARLAGRRSTTRPVLDRYRGAAEARTRDLYDPRLFREQVFVPAVGEMAAALAADAAVGAWSLPDPDGRMGAAVARGLGAPVQSADVQAAVGDTGAAASLLGLLPGLGGPGTVGAVGYGGGRTTGITVEVVTAVPGSASIEAVLAGGRPATYAEALRARDVLVPDTDPVPMGIPPGAAGFVRGGHDLLALRGGRCADCGTISTPLAVHPTCIGCGGPKLEPVDLARTGTVHTFVVNQVMPAPFEAPLPLVVLDLSDGARLMVQAVGDGSEVAVGAAATLVLRRYAVERGAPVYGYKARMG